MQNTFVFFAAILVFFMIAEITTRVIYFAENKISAWDHEDLCNQGYYRKGMVQNGSPELFPLIDFDPVVGWTNRKGYVTDQDNDIDAPIVYGWDSSLNISGYFHVNPQGMRMLHEAELNKSAKNRIVLLGDSFTFGEGERTHLTFPTLLEPLLPDSEVLNFGVQGYSFTQMYLTFLSKALDYSPTHAIFVIYIDDIARNEQPCAYSFYPHFADGSSSPVLSPQEFIMSYRPPIVKSYFINWIHFTARHVSYAKSNFESGYVTTERILRQLKPYDNDAVPVLFMVILGKHPTKLQVEQLPRLISLLRKYGYAYIYYDQYAASQRFVPEIYQKIYDNHFSPVGNVLAASFLASQLNSQFNISISEQGFRLKVDDAAEISVEYPNGTLVQFRHIRAHYPLMLPTTCNRRGCTLDNPDAPFFKVNYYALQDVVNASRIDTVNMSIN